MRKSTELKGLVLFHKFCITFGSIAQKGLLVVSPPEDIAIGCVSNYITNHSVQWFLNGFLLNSN